MIRSERLLFSGIENNARIFGVNTIIHPQPNPNLSLYYNNPYFRYNHWNVSEIRVLYISGLKNSFEHFESKSDNSLTCNPKVRLLCRFPFETVNTTLCYGSFCLKIVSDRNQMWPKSHKSHNYSQILFRKVKFTETFFLFSRFRIEPRLLGTSDQLLTMPPTLWINFYDHT